ncbi:type 1 glutamine amidotransferase [Caedibacter taeniospiralis]|jgi:GMP synthase-like glutamine amidotransferase|uniref:glutamine amidotransferase-related protein n=1 Tax=Caedibacter taeniospiralis TaxID=28907 RepID=UPI0037C1A3BA
MKIALLQADHVPEYRRCISGGNYPDMFANLFLKVFTIVDIDVFDVTVGEYPDDLNRYEKYIITGSKATTFERLDWICVLEDKIKTLYHLKKKIVGICFGHQILAQALGGRVERSIKGWGVGVQCIKILEKMEWMCPYHDHLSLTFYHQDQVVELPKNAKLIATNTFCPVQMFVIGDQIWGMQAHPEMLRAHNHLLIKEQKDTLSHCFESGMDSLRIRDHGSVVAQWMVNFYEGVKDDCW